MSNPQQFPNPASEMQTAEPVQTEERFALGARTLPMMVYDLDLRTLRANARHGLTDLLGYELAEAELSFEWWVRQIHPEDAAACRAALRSLQANPRHHGMRYRMHHKDGRILCVEDHAMPVCDQAGPATRIIGAVQDVTERRQTEEELQKSAQILRSLLKNLPDLIFAKDRQGRIAYASESTLRLLGKASEEILGRTDAEICPDPRLGKAVMENDRIVRETGRLLIVEEPARLPDGSLRTFLSTKVPWIAEDEGLLGTLSVVTDITDRKRAEEQSRLLAQTAEKLLKSADPQAVVNDLCQEVMRFLDCQAFFNFLVDEPTGRLHLNACAGIPEEQARKIEWLDYGVAVCGCVAQSGERMIAEYISLSSDLRTELVRSYGIQAYCCHPLKTHDRLLGTLSFGTQTRPRFTAFEIEVMRIIADQVAVAMQRIQTESSLQELNATLEQRIEERTAEATTLASQLRELASELTLAEQRERQRLGKVLHDHIQQMLVAAKLQASILVNRQSSESLTASARLVYELLDQTLSASRTLTAELSPPILQEGGLGPALQWLARSFLEKYGLKVEVLFDPTGDPVVEDLRGFLFDAAREILFNVVKHSGVERASVNCFRGKDNRMHVAVSDQGKGFDPTQLMGRKTEGYGLFSIQQRITHMGGRLEIDSAPGQGTRITVIGPMPLTVAEKPHPEPQQAQPAISAEKPSGPEKIRIVLADDHHIIRQGLASLLRLEPDIEIVGEASNGAQAINLARSLRPDVVVMDVSMPVVNGVEATAEIQRDLPGIQVIGLSMHEDGDILSSIREAGAIAYVSKAGPPEALVRAIHKAAGVKSSC